MKRKRYNVTSIKKIIPIFVCCFCLGCASMFTDVKISKLESQGKIHTGMTLFQVSREIVGREPNTFVDIFQQERDNNETYEVWHINGRVHSQNLSKTYFFKFKDRRLVTWGWQ